MGETEADSLPPDLAAIPRDRWPQHVAIIMDGNGRWAMRRGLPRVAGHREGADRVHDIVEEASDLAWVGSRSSRSATRTGAVPPQKSTS